MHKCYNVRVNFLSVASVYPTMKSATNPYMFSVGGTNVTGTSGQNIDDLLRNTRLVWLINLNAPLTSHLALDYNTKRLKRTRLFIFILQFNQFIMTSK